MPWRPGEGEEGGEWEVGGEGCWRGRRSCDEKGLPTPESVTDKVLGHRFSTLAHREDTGTHAPP